MHLKRTLIQWQILVDAAQHGGFTSDGFHCFRRAAQNKSRNNVSGAEVLLLRLIYAVTFIMSSETGSLEDRMLSYSNQAEM